MAVDLLNAAISAGISGAISYFVSRRCLTVGRRREAAVAVIDATARLEGYLTSVQGGFANWETIHTATGETESAHQFHSQLNAAVRRLSPCLSARHRMRLARILAEIDSPAAQQNLPDALAVIERIRTCCAQY